MNEKRQMLLHFLAVLAYRMQKALRDASEDFGDFQPGNEIRTPKALVRHMTSVLGYARTFFIGGNYWPDELRTMQDEVERFHDMLAALKEHLDKGDRLLDGLTEESLLQGPFADALSHVGQLALLRRQHGDPVPPENFIVAAISGKNLTSDQPEPASPDKIWPERPPKP